MANKILYKSGYKYQLVEKYIITIPELMDLDRKPINTSYIDLLNNGWLKIHSGYAFDGPSGPTIDTKNFMRGSLIHDVIYQLIRIGKLPITYRQRADELLREMCIHDGMSAFRARYVYWGCRWFAKRAASGKPKKVIEAP